MSKGQGLSITTIVVAAVALLILVVLVAVFTGQFSGFSSTIRNCESAGGSCMNPEIDDFNRADFVRLAGKRCAEEGAVCYASLQGSCGLNAGELAADVSAEDRQTALDECQSKDTATSCAAVSHCRWA